MIQEPRLTTVDEIRKQARSALQARVREDEARAEEAKKKGETYERKVFMEHFDAPEYQQWIDNLVEKTRRNGLLVTTQQLADFKAARPLKQGDKVRYIGPQRLETTRAGKKYLRRTGQVGRITDVVQGQDGLPILTFRPDVPKEVQSAHGPDMFVAELQVKALTVGYWTLERIP